MKRPVTKLAMRSEKLPLHLGKKIRDGKRQSQSLAKRRMNNSIGEINQVNSIDMDMKATSLFNKATILNGVSLDNGMSGLPNDLNLSSMNMNMNMNMGDLKSLSSRNPMTGMPNMANSSGVMGSMGVNGVGIGMNSIQPGCYSRELEEMLVMNRLRTDLVSSGGASTADSSLLVNIYGNRNSSGDSGGFSGVKARVDMDDSTIMEQLQRRRLRMGASANKEDAINMIPDSNQLSFWTEKNNPSSNQSSNNLSMDLNINSSALNGMHDSTNARSNQAISMGMVALGGPQGNFDKLHSNNLDSMSTNVLLSKLAAGNPTFMQGASNFGNGSISTMGHSTMHVNNNQGSMSNAMRVMDDKKFSNFMDGHAGQQSLNQIQDPFNFNRR
mmetsp:Transcript_10506/g.30719  ORF Transcript_10506/g.30719 Transcript_10506/m.30719 type:complete len:384 (-) Transcript_10506:147-1298(-)